MMAASQFVTLKIQMIQQMGNKIIKRPKAIDPAICHPRNGVAKIKIKGSVQSQMSSARAIVVQ
jgi:hypothetical protein